MDNYQLQNRPNLYYRPKDSQRIIVQDIQSPNNTISQNSQETTVPETKLPNRSLTQNYTQKTSVRNVQSLNTSAFSQKPQRTRKANSLNKPPVRNNAQKINRNVQSRNNPPLFQNPRRTNVPKPQSLNKPPEQNSPLKTNVPPNNPTLFQNTQASTLQQPNLDPNINVITSLSPINSKGILDRKVKDHTQLIKIKISKEMINHCPLYQYTGPTTLISTLPDAVGALNTLIEEPLLGFDTETRPAFKKGESYLPSLIQLATQNRAFIFQLHSIDITPFKPLFENPKIMKVGVGIHLDLMGLKKMGQFKPQGFVDVSQHANCKMIHNKGLQALAAYFLEVRISKKQQLSNWANLNLTNPQIIYAATDAWISREVYLKLDNLENTPQPQLLESNPSIPTIVNS